MNKVENTDRSERFLHCFNAVDYGLRTKYDFNRSMGFSELVRRCVPINFIVRKYEDDLIDYGRLRNSIVHQSREDMVIAEPHLSAVENFEKIEAMLNKPTLVIDTEFCCREVLKIEGALAMQEVIQLIAKSGYSNLPVYKNNSLIGIANGQRIIDAFGLFLESGGKSKTFLENIKIEDLLVKMPTEEYNVLKSIRLTVEEAITEFNKNLKLRTILITQNGTVNESPIAIVTRSDAIGLNKLLDK